MVWRGKSGPLGRVRLGSGSAACVLFVLMLGVSGCGSDDEGDDDGGGGSGSNEPRKPDTGYGANEPVPGPRECAPFCERFGDCLVALCSEDDQTSIYDGLGALVAGACEQSCNTTVLNSAEFTSAKWQCFFQSSCREVFDYDECDLDGSYFCSM
jgi:hypothetical protein